MATVITDEEFRRLVILLCDAVGLGLSYSADLRSNFNVVDEYGSRSLDLAEKSSQNERLELIVEAMAVDVDQGEVSALLFGSDVRAGELQLYRGDGLPILKTMQASDFQIGYIPKRPARRPD